jgi:hypothetical protein
MQMLATNLGGTFLGGRQADRLSRDLCLVFVTDRGAESVLPLLADPLVPDPDYIMADVGATVLHGDGRHPVTPLPWELSTRRVGTDPILDALHDMPALVRERVPRERRCSNLLEDAGLLDEVRAHLAHLDVDVLYSAAADVASFTPLRDSLNQVAREGQAVCGRRRRPAALRVRRCGGGAAHQTAGRDRGTP